MHLGTKPRHLALFGSAPDTGNLGVSALLTAALAGIHREASDVAISVFDHGRGIRRNRYQLSEQLSIEVDFVGARAGRRYFMPENLTAMSLLSKCGSFGSWLNPNIRLMDSTDAVLDISGGDSFSDIYGEKRFFAAVLPKLIAISRAIPLILLPQTYGPFAQPRLRAIAERVAQNSTMAWARDADSFQNLKELLGEKFDPKRHHCGVDLAFALPPISASQHLTPPLLSWLRSRKETEPLVGLNVSGLIYNDPELAKNHYRFRADYREIVYRTVKWLTDEIGARVVLVPHVLVHSGHRESDLDACKAVAQRFDGSSAKRILVCDANLSAGEAKWLISHFAWFCGMRMHSTIAALSSGVPTAAISYSEKTAGVFSTCGQRSHVFDPCKQDVSEIFAGLQHSFESNASSRDSLCAALKNVRAQCDAQMKAVVQCALSFTLPSKAGNF